MDEVGNELGDFLSLPLGRHVTSAMNCNEHEIPVFGQMTREFPVGAPLTLYSSSRVVLIFDPHLGPMCGDCGVCCPGVVHDLVFVLEFSVNPRTSLHLTTIVPQDVVVAYFEILYGIWNVKGFADFLGVKVISHVLCFDGVRFKENMIIPHSH